MLALIARLRGGESVVLWRPIIFPLVYGHGITALLCEFDAVKCLDSAIIARYEYHSNNHVLPIAFAVTRFVPCFSLNFEPCTNQLAHRMRF